MPKWNPKKTSLTEEQWDAIHNEHPDFPVDYPEDALDGSLPHPDEMY